MNNEPNKPTELTEKELEGIAGGDFAIKPGTVRLGSLHGDPLHGDPLQRELKQEANVTVSSEWQG